MRLFALCLLCAIALFMNSPIQAGTAGEKPAGGKPTKLDAPANIMCMSAGDTLTVTWDVVADSAGYKVMVEGDEDQSLSRNVVAPPFTQPVSTITDDPTTALVVKVRALHGQARKNDSKPSASVTCTTPVVNPLTPAKP
jgi:hypothetical protein